MFTRKTWPILGLAALVLGGCTADADKHYTNAGVYAKQAGQEAGKAIESDLNHAKDATQSAVANDKKSLAVREGLTDRPDIKVSNLSVDTNGAQITLRGTVPTREMNQKAKSLAKTIAGPGYTIDDHLTILDQPVK